MFYISWITICLSIYMYTFTPIYYIWTKEHRFYSSFKWYEIFFIFFWSFFRHFPVLKNKKNECQCIHDSFIKNGWLLSSLFFILFFLIFWVFSGVIIIIQKPFLSYTFYYNIFRLDFGLPSCRKNNNNQNPFYPAEAGLLFASFLQWKNKNLSIFTEKKLILWIFSAKI